MDYILNNEVYGNTVNDRPLVYLKDVSDRIIEDAGQVFLIKCDNIVIRNQSFSKTSTGIELFNSDNCVILNNTFN